MLTINTTLTGVMRIVQVVSVLVHMLLLGSGSAVDEGPLVETKSGWLRGNYTSTRGGRQVLEFLGVPYAQSPTGSLRFKVTVARSSVLAVYSRCYCFPMFKTTYSPYY